MQTMRPCTIVGSDYAEPFTMPGAGNDEPHISHLAVCIAGKQLSKCRPLRPSHFRVYDPHQSLKGAKATAKISYLPCGVIRTRHHSGNKQAHPLAVLIGNHGDIGRCERAAKTARFHYPADD
jgi:hypothetical protein